MEQSHTDLGEGVVGTGASACPARPLSRLQRRLFIRLSARTHGMLGASALARWQGERRRERGEGGGERRKQTLMKNPVKSEYPHWAPTGTEPAESSSAYHTVPTLLSTDKGSIAGETDVQTCVCEISQSVGGKEARPGK